VIKDAIQQWDRTKEKLTSLRYEMAQICAQALIKEFANELDRFTFKEGTSLKFSFEWGTLTLSLMRGGRRRYQWDGEARPSGRQGKMPLLGMTDYPLCKVLIRICKTLGELNTTEDETMLNALTGNSIPLNGPKLVREENTWKIKEVVCV
jgi:hypothetical protein